MAGATPPTRPVLRERYDRRRAQVIASAARLFAKNGYQQTSIADLTEFTGMTAGGLYHYIGSKEQLLIAICDELLDPLLPRARHIVAGEAPAPAHLRRLVHAWVDHIAGHLDHMLVFTQERHVIEREPQWRHVRRQRKAFEQILDETLARGEAEGTMSFDDRHLALFALLGMVNYTPQWLRPGGRLSADEIADGYCDIVLGEGFGDTPKERRRAA
jgi:AcrR family transcriptional regulator